MGCEGNIELSLIGDGQYLLKKRGIPHFISDGNIAIVPALTDHFGAHVNLTTYNNEIDAYADPGLMEGYGTQFVPIYDSYSDGPEIALGLLIFKIDCFENIINATNSPYRDIGAESLEYLRPIWKRLVAGVWAVSSYIESGRSQDRMYFWNHVSSIEVKQKINYEIWT